MEPLPARRGDERDSLESEMRQYMLGRLSEEEEQRFDERLMGDDEVFREVDELSEVVQDELVEDYLSGNLNEDDRNAFEQRLLGSPEVRDKLPLSRALLGLSDRRVDPPSLWQRLAHWLQPVLLPAPAALTASLLFAAVAVGIVSVDRINKLETQLGEVEGFRAQLVSTQQSLSNQTEELEAANSRLLDLEQTLQTMQSQAARALASFILMPGLERSGGETALVSIAAGEDLVELKLDLGLDEHRSYEARLYGSSGIELVTQHQLPAIPSADTVHVVVLIPSRTLSSDDYQIRLYGVTSGGQSEMIDTYPFRVVRP